MYNTAGKAAGSRAVVLCRNMDPSSSAAHAGVEGCLVGEGLTSGSTSGEEQALSLLLVVIHSLSSSNK